MQTNLYAVTVPLFTKHLMNLGKLLEKAEAHAGDDANELVRLMNDSLAEDMFPLGKQIEMATDNAKGATGRLSGKEAPSFPDGDYTPETLKARLRDTLAYLASVSESDFDGAEERTVTLAWFPGKELTGFGYATEYALPNFFFHVTIAYAILRKEGVGLGKADFIGGLPFTDAAV